MSAVLKPVASNSAGYTSVQTPLDKTLTPEIVIALCGPMGTPLHDVAQVFKKLLLNQPYSYTLVEIIKLSDEIRSKAGLGKDATTEQLIDAGNNLREQHDNSYLVQLAIKKILLARRKDDVESRQASIDGVVVPAKPIRHCHIIDSIKNIDELRLLQSVYGDMLHVVGVYCPIEIRIQRLLKKNSDDNIRKLINRDSGEELKHGQLVRDTFPFSDFFLRADTDTSTQLESRVGRFLDLMLGAKIITPTPHEQAMYAAYSAARGSACLSRQVGAAITNSEGEVLATGWNDVPKAFGGLYHTSVNSISNSDNDHRCWNKDGGKCFNDEEKTAISKTVAQILVDSELISIEKVAMAEQVIRNASQLKDLIEFSRAVHAEMHALLNAGSNHGGQINGGKLFVTTYPCHSCARHLVAAGIKEVFYIEPYRKSLATRLHSDAITENEADTTKVRIKPFDGVAPARFLRFFSSPITGRKDKATGRMLQGVVMPVTARSMEAIETLEALAIRGV